MRFLLFFLCSITFSLSHAQESYAGTYDIQFGEIGQETLVLQTDGTFEYSYSHLIKDNKLPKEQYAKGTWTQEKKIIKLHTTPQDLNEKYTLNLNKSRARSNRRSPRNTSTTPYKESLRFFESPIFWFKGREFIKQ